MSSKWLVCPFEGTSCRIYETPVDSYKDLVALSLLQMLVKPLKFAKSKNPYLLARRCEWHIWAVTVAIMTAKCLSSFPIHFFLKKFSFPTTLNIPKLLLYVKFTFPYSSVHEFWNTLYILYGKYLLQFSIGKKKKYFHIRSVYRTVCFATWKIRMDS